MINKLADKRKKSIEMFNNEIEKLKFLGKDIELTEFKYKEYNDNFNGYFYHLISKKYLKSLKEKGLVLSWHETTVYYMVTKRLTESEIKMWKGKPFPDDLFYVKRGLGGD